MNQPQIVVSFTGHRSYDHSADETLRNTITSLYNLGARRFRVGMAEGFDMIAAEMILELMSEDSNIAIEAYIPWQEFDSHFSKSEASRFYNIVKHCDAVYYAAKEYNKGVYHKRNDMLIEGADYLIAWWDGSSSGTGYTVKRAKQQHLKIINLYPSPQMKLQL